MILKDLLSFIDPLKSIKYHEFRDELEKRAEILGKNAGIRERAGSDFGMHYPEWMNRVLKEGNFYTLQRVQIKGHAKYTPKDLKPFVLDLLTWDPLMAAHMVRHYASLSGVRERLEDDLWKAFEIIPHLNNEKVDGSKVVETIAYSVFMRKDLGGAQGRFDNIGEPILRKANLDTIALLQENGYVPKGFSGFGGILADYELRTSVGEKMGDINPEVAEFIINR